MNTNLCEIGFVIDRSGSMNAMKEEAIGGINTFLESQQKLPGEARLTLVLFDHSLRADSESADSDHLRTFA